MTRSPRPAARSWAGGAPEASPPPAAPSHVAALGSAAIHGRCRKSAAAPLAAAGAAIGGLTLAGLVAPHGQAFYPRCPLYALTGIYCPGCGATRAVHALATGHLVTALHDNLVLVAAV